MPSSDELRFERNRLPVDRDITGGIPSIYDPARDERGTEEDTSLYKDYGFAMTENQKRLEDLYKESVADITGQYTPVTDFDKAYQEWYKSGYQPESFISSGYTGEEGSGLTNLIPQLTRVNSQWYGGGNFTPISGMTELPVIETRTRVVNDPEFGPTSIVESLVGTQGYTYDEAGNEIPREVWVSGDRNYTPLGSTGQYIPKELTDTEQISQYMSDPATWQEAFKTEWYNTQPEQFSKANTEFYSAITELARQKTGVYDSLGVRTNNRLYLDESNDYDRTVLSMQQRFEDRIAKKNETLKQLLSIK